MLHDGTRIAIKVTRIANDPEVEVESRKRRKLEHATRELYHWSKLKHPNVLPLMGLAVFRGVLSVISELVDNGSLVSYLRRYSYANRIALCMGVCAGLYYIHNSGMIHGSLRGERFSSRGWNLDPKLQFMAVRQIS